MRRRDVDVIGRGSPLRAAYDEILPLVEKPGRYLGGERGTDRKALDPSTLRIVLAFPDVYEIGQSHLGLQILYDLLNRAPGIAAERVYAPWTDMEALLRRRGIPLASLETCTSLDTFQIVGFSLQYELTYTNVLTMLELGRIPLAAGDRRPEHPLVIGGGPGAFNPEPIAEFFDAFILGDGEEVIVDVCAVYRAWDHRCRTTLLEALRRVPGVYVPAFFEPRYRPDGVLSEIVPLRQDYAIVEKRVLRDLNASPVPSQPLVPNINIVHERSTIEVMRGCVKGCRFCQAGYVYRPQRERDPRTVVAEATRLIDATGYEELSLLSLSTGDYSCINPLVRDLMNRFEPRRVALSLPSTRIDAISPHVLLELRRTRRTGCTLAPEAGSQRLRDIIQKAYREEELIEAARLIFELGWPSLKLYFMIGLPGETEADLLGIVDLCRKVAAAGTGRPDVTASVSTFVPKPHTPFQWAAQLDPAEIGARQAVLRRELGRYRIRFKWHDSRLSHLEGIFSRGDRRLARLLLVAQRLGCRFDGWTDHCRWDLWEQAMAECGVDPAFYLRRRLLGEALPWDHLHAGVTKKYLARELARAVEGVLTPDCSIERCTYCGACDFETIRNMTYHLRGAKGALHRGHEIDAWARGQLPETPAWETRTWQAAQERLGSREGRAGTTPTPTLGAETPMPISLTETAAGARGHHPQTRGEGNADEWLRANNPTVRGSTNGNGRRACARVRLQYAKDGPASFIGSRELAELFYRALRRGRIPVAFSEGYHPLPRLSFSPGLPLGAASESEFLDVDLSERLDPATLATRLAAQLPPGLRILTASAVPLDGPRLEPTITGFRYTVALPEPWKDTTRLQARIAAFREAPSFPVRKRSKHGGTKTIDARATTSIRLGRPGHLEVDVQCASQGTPQPASVVAALLELDDETARRLRVTKLATLFRNDAERAPSSTAPDAEEASS